MISKNINIDNLAQRGAKRTIELLCVVGCVEEKQLDKTPFPNIGAVVGRTVPATRNALPFGTQVLRPYSFPPQNASGHWVYGYSVFCFVRRGVYSFRHTEDGREGGHRAPVP